jgi:hypothetical protein
MAKSSKTKTTKVVKIENTKTTEPKKQVVEETKPIEPSVTPEAVPLSVAEESVIKQTMAEKDVSRDEAIEILKKQNES